MSYGLISGLIGLIGFSVSLARIVRKANHRASGDHVTQTVLTRI